MAFFRTLVIAAVVSALIGFLVSAQSSSKASDGSTCSFDSRCRSNRCEGGRCCRSFTDRHCDDCDWNGRCEGCDRNYRLNGDSCDEWFSDGTTCSSSRSCQSGVCYDRCCDSTDRNVRDARCDSCGSSGSCRSCLSFYTMVHSVCISQNDRNFGAGHPCLTTDNCAGNARCLNQRCCNLVGIDERCDSCATTGKCNSCVTGYLYDTTFETCRPEATFGETCGLTATSAKCLDGDTRCRGSRCCTTRVQETCNACSQDRGFCSGCDSGYQQVNKIACASTAAIAYAELQMTRVTSQECRTNLTRRAFLFDSGALCYDNSTLTRKACESVASSIPDQTQWLCIDNANAVMNSARRSSSGEILNIGQQDGTTYGCITENEPFIAKLKSSQDICAAARTSGAVALSALLPLAVLVALVVALL